MHWCQTDTIIKIKMQLGFYVNFYVNVNIFDLGCMKMIDRGKGENLKNEYLVCIHFHK